jgi:hypothetical protein
MVDEQGENLREKALQRLKKKRDFMAHLLSYVFVNGFLVILWLAVGDGFFWPMFPILGWGIGVFFHGWDVYRGVPSEEEIAKEMARIGRSGA